MIKIYLTFSKSLQSVSELKNYAEKENIQFIKASDDYTPSGTYNFLLLEKREEGLYSDIQFRSEEKFDVTGYYDEKRNNVDDIMKAKKVLSGLLTKPAVLNYQQIKSLTKLDILIYNSIEENVKAASYDLTLHKNHFVSGARYEDITDYVKIDPLDFVIVRANESANIPKNISANFDILVSMFCKGIILSNGPQVDPGYKGRFLCLLYNSSSQAFSSKLNDRYCTVVFNALNSSSNKPYNGRYQKKPEIPDYVTPFAIEGVSSNIGRINEIKNEIHSLKENQGECSKKIEDLLGDVSTNSSDIKMISRWKTALLSFVLAVFGFIIAFIVATDYYGVYSDMGEIKSNYQQLSIENNNLKETILNLKSEDYKKAVEKINMLEEKIKELQNNQKPPVK